LTKTNNHYINITNNVAERVVRDWLDIRVTKKGWIIQPLFDFIQEDSHQKHLTHQMEMTHMDNCQYHNRTLYHNDQKGEN